jgi:hypothetical protein
MYNLNIGKEEKGNGFRSSVSSSSSSIATGHAVNGLSIGSLLRTYAGMVRR